VVPRDHRIEVLDAATLQVRANLSGHTDTPDCLCFSPDGLLLASCSADGTIRVWDAFRGHLLALLRGQSGRAWSAAFSPDGKTLAAGSADGKLHLWDVSALGRPSP